MYSEVHVEKIEQRAQAAGISQLLTLYRSLGTDGLPARTAFTDEMLKPHLPFLMLLEPLGSGEYLYSLYGTSIAAVAGIDMTGKTTADFNSPAGKFFKEMYDRAAKLRSPVYTVHKAVHAKFSHTWERLMLPVVMDTGTIGFIVYNCPRSFESDYLRTLLAMIPDGIFCLRALRDDSGAIVDAAFESANEAAQTLLGLTARELNEQTFLTVCPDSVFKGTMGRICSAIEHRKTIVHETKSEIGQETRWYRKTISPMNDGVVIHLSDITDLKCEVLDLERRQLEMALSIEQHQNESDELRRLASTDSLTGLLNRRGFFSCTRDILAKCREGQGKFVAVLTDIDRFKAVNDRYGHGIGDAVLTHFADLIGRWAEDNAAVAGRLGGEEFVLLVPVSQNQSFDLIDRLRTQVAVSPAMTDLGPIPITASFGVAEWQDGERMDHLLERADEAVYQAKSGGRNRVVVCQPDRPFAMPVWANRS